MNFFLLMYIIDFVVISARAGLHNEDRLMEVNDENVTQRNHDGKIEISYFLYILLFVF